jgi:hypothetical protein
MRRTGIEPVSKAWKAAILPLNYRRKMDGVGIEPTTFRMQIENSTN